jgi:hypothetical protein
MISQNRSPIGQLLVRVCDLILKEIWNCGIGRDENTPSDPV